MLRPREKGIIKELHTLFCFDEEELMLSAIRIMKKGYGAECTIITERDGRNVIFESTIKNLDCQIDLDAQLKHISFQHGCVYSYDGVYSYTRAYPLDLGEKTIGAVLLDGVKAIPEVSDMVLEQLAILTRHAELKEDASLARMRDRLTNLKNLNGLYDTFEREKNRLFGGYLACIRLKNRIELLNSKGIQSENDFMIKVSNIILRNMVRQVYHTERDVWVCLITPRKGVLTEEERADFTEDVGNQLDNLLQELNDGIRGAEFSIAYSKMKEDLRYCLFTCEGSTLNYTVNEVRYVKEIAEEALREEVEKRAGKKEEESPFSHTVYHMDSPGSVEMENEDAAADVSGVYREMEEEPDETVSERDRDVFDFNEEESDSENTADDTEQTGADSDGADEEEAFVILGGEESEE